MFVCGGALTLMGSGAAACEGGCTKSGSPTTATSEPSRAPAAPEPTPVPREPRAAPAQQGAAQPKLPTGKVVLETAPRQAIELTVEVASTDATRQLGLMFREELKEDEGMLFIFPTERRNSFWMRNTLIPLDMLFIDSEWKVVGIVERAQPQTDDPRGVPRMSQYVLEVPGGFAERHGLSTDTVVRFTPPPGMDL